MLEFFKKEMKAMKKSLQAMLGVTLLEIMLVLAIASMVIVMSIRYYQSASNNQKINAALDTITGIVGAGESYLAGAPANGFTGATMATLTPFLGGSAPVSPWGGAITVTGVNSTSYTISMPASAAANVCTQVTGALAQNNKFTAVTCAGGTLKLTVNE